MDSRATISTEIAKLIACWADSSPERPILVTAASNRSRSPATEAANASRTSGSTLLSIFIGALPCGYVLGTRAPVPGRAGSGYLRGRFSLQTLQDRVQEIGPLNVVG